ncbi:MAG: class II fructose-1,6-bisphosphate aldolase [Anaeroplasmataceae bacterium]
MTLVNCKDMLKKAKDEKYAVAAFNINNLEWIKSILIKSQQLNSPVILEASESAVRYMCGYKNVHDMVVNAIKELNITIPVALHLDHGTYDGVIEALNSGFTSVMYDGSHFDFNTNLENTKKIVDLAKKYNASVEAEVGSIGGEEDGISSHGEIASIEECVAISETKIDMLAAGIGNIHGNYPSDWTGLDFEILKKIKNETHDIPLVLHGGSGIPKQQVKKAITLGVTKVNVNTELQIAFSNALNIYYSSKLNEEPKGYDPRKILKFASEEIQKTIEDKILMFGSNDKALC